MERIDIWLDEKTLKNLKSISKKLASPGNLSLTEEEVRTVKKLRQQGNLPPHLIKYFLAQGLTRLNAEIRRA